MPDARWTETFVRHLASLPSAMLDSIGRHPGLVNRRPAATAGPEDPTEGPSDSSAHEAYRHVATPPFRDFRHDHHGIRTRPAAVGCRRPAGRPRPPERTAAQDAVGGAG